MEQEFWDALHLRYPLEYTQSLCLSDSIAFRRARIPFDGTRILGWLAS